MYRGISTLARTMLKNGKEMNRHHPTPLPHPKLFLLLFIRKMYETFLAF
jgi:hypothetical protein